MFLERILVLCLHMVLTASQTPILVIYNEMTSQLQDFVKSRTSTAFPDLEVHHKVINDTAVFSQLNSLCTEQGQWAAILDLTAARHCGLGHVAVASDMAYLSISDAPCRLQFEEDNKDMYLSLVAPDQMYLDALTTTATDLIDITSYNIAIFYDESFSDIIPTVFVEEKDVFYYLVKMENENAKISSQLQNIRKDMSVRVFIVLASFENAENLLKSAVQKEMTASFYYWLVVTKDVVFSSAPTFCEDCQTTIAFSRMITKDDLSRRLGSSFHLVTKDMMNMAVIIQDSLKVLQNFVKREKPKSVSISCSATAATSSNTFFQFAQSLKSKHEGLTGPVGIDDVTEKPILTLDVLRPAGQDFVEVGVWNNSGITTYEKVFHEVGLWPKLRILTLAEPPFVFRKAEGGKIKYEGYAISVLEKVAQAVKFRYEIVEPSDGIFGDISDNGSWTGMIGELVAGRADMIVATLAVTLERDTVIDFTIPYYDYAGIQILTKVNAQETDLFRFINVFNGRVWATVFSTLFCMTILIYLFDRFSPFSYQNCKEAYPDGGKIFTIKESAWFVMGSFTKSGEGETPKSFSSRVLVSGFWFFCTVIMATYTANLAAFLTVSRLQTTITSLDSLADQNKVDYSFVRHSDTEAYFMHMRSIEREFYLRWKEMSLGSIYSSASNQSSQFAVWDYPLGDKFTNMWTTIQSHGILNTSAEGVAKVQQGNFAFIHSSPVLKYYASQHCDLTVVGEQFSTKPYAFALQENSPLVGRINKEILNLQGERMLEDLKIKWWEGDKPTCPKSTSTSGSGITLSTVGGVFIFLAIGVAVCLLILGAEVSMHRLWNRVTERRGYAPNSANTGQQPDVILPGKSG